MSDDQRLKEIREHLSKLRKDYITATPLQRLRIIKDRLDYPHSGPNQLITMVSAAEAFSRSLLVELERPSSDEDRLRIYETFRFKNGKELVLLLKERWNTLPIDDTLSEWFSLAVDYRNLLAHECTFLRQQYSFPLIEAAQQVLSILRDESIRRGLVPEDFREYVP